MTTEEIKNEIADLEFAIELYRDAPKIEFERFLEFRKKARLSYAAGDFDEGDDFLTEAIIHHLVYDKICTQLSNGLKRIEKLKESLKEKREQK